MSVFTDQPALIPNPDGRTWTLFTKLTYYVGVENGPEVIVVPYGYVTDLASVPRVLWNIYPPFGKYDNAAIVHDYLYSNGGVIPNGYRTYTKADADNIFHEACLVLGVGPKTAWMMYQAVHFFGKGEFKK